MPQRAILKKIESDRAATVAQTSGQPILDVEAHSNPGSTPFVDYLHGDMLHRLQPPRSDEPEELTFICMAYVNEILFKLLCVETLRVQDALSRDALADAIALLARRGYAVGEKALARDWSLPHESDPRVQAAWREVYATLPVSHELYQLAESLVDLAERFKFWRFRHFTTVKRLIGSKPGTGGTAGSAWLRLIAPRHYSNFFTELWDVRTTL